GQRGQGIGLGSRRIKRVSARQTGNPDFPFRLGVIRFQFRVTDWPIREAGASDGTPSAAFNKVDFVKAPVVGREVNRSPADALPVLHSGHYNRPVFVSLAKS